MNRCQQKLVISYFLNSIIGPHGLPSSNSLLKYVQEFALINNLNKPLGDDFSTP